MKILDPNEFVTLEIDDDGTRFFEAFLDRNFHGWRDHQCHIAKNAGTILRQWQLRVDDIMRTALYRKKYVEIDDYVITLDESDNAKIHNLKRIICDIDGDASEVAVWGVRSSAQ